MLDIKTYRHSFFIDDADKIFIDNVTDTIDHFGFDDIYVKDSDELSLSDASRETTRYYRRFALTVSINDARQASLQRRFYEAMKANDTKRISIRASHFERLPIRELARKSIKTKKYDALTVSINDARQANLQRQESIQAAEFVWKNVKVLKKETLLNTLLMRSQKSFDRFIKEHMQAIEMPFKRVYKPFAENAALRDAKKTNTIKNSYETLSPREHLDRKAAFVRMFGERLSATDDYRRLFEIFKKENQISIRDIRIKQTPCGVLSDIVVNNHGITLDEFNRLANKASGYNTFSEFKVGEYEYKDAIYRLAIRKKNAASNPLVYDYAIHVDIDDVKDRGAADIPAEETKVYFNRTYYTTPDVVVNVCGGMEGEPVIPYITEQGEDDRGKYFKIILRNAAGKVVAGRISWNSNGY